MVCHVSVDQVRTTIQKISNFSRFLKVCSHCFHHCAADAQTGCIRLLDETARRDCQITVLHCQAYSDKLQRLSTLLTVEGAAEAQVWITHQRDAIL